MALRGKEPEAGTKRLKGFMYSPAGVGKTMAAIQFPNAYIIDCEHGTDEYGAVIKANKSKVFHTTMIEEVIEEVRALLTERHPFRTLVIDPITTAYDDLVDRCEARVGSDLRWATHGDPRENINNHPHPVDGGWFVHNGIVSNYERLVVSKRLYPVSECDTEAVGLLVEAEEGTLIQRFGKSIDSTVGDLAVMALWTRPMQLLIARRGNPLNGVLHKDSLYFATVAAGMPGRPVPMPDNAAYLFESAGEPKSSLKLRKPREERWRQGLFSKGEYAGG